MAWLNTKPDPLNKKSGETQRRIEGMKAAGIEPELPPNPLPYITEWLFEVGPTSPGGMGPAAVSWRDLEAWRALAGVDLMPWEAKLLRRLSTDFVNELHDAKKPDCPAPWASETERNRDAVSRKVGNAFKALALAKRK